MEILKAEHIGYCYGVRRAAEMAMAQVAETDGPILTLGPLMHNPQEVLRLEALGVRQVGERKLEELSGQCLLLRSHGVALDLVQKAQAHGIRLLDATCPYVKLPRRNLIEFGQQGRHVFLIGEEHHPEIIAQLSYAVGSVSVINSAQQIPDIPREKPVAVLAQTTLNRKHFESIVLVVRGRFSDVMVADTICAETDRRQAECRQLAQRSDAVVVVGGRNSANTRRLADLARLIQPNTYHVEKADELPWPLPGRPEVVALCSGASTPDWLILEVEERLAQK